MAKGSRGGLTPEEQADLIAQFESGDLSVWRELLAEGVANDADPDSLKSFANKAPDRYMQRLMMIAKLAGVHHDKLEVEGTGLIAFARQIQGMSDAQLEAEYQRRIQPKPAKVIDITPQAGAPAQDDTPPASPRAAHP